MGGFSLILLIVGSLATGATRHQVYTGFRSRLGGRIATGFVSFSHDEEKPIKRIIYFSFLSLFMVYYSFGYLLC
jgi:calcineurin-like phosphoesterase family protein